MGDFVAIERDPREGTFEQEFIELFEARFEGWKPAEGDQLVWLAKAWERKGSNFEDQASVMSRAAFKEFGEKVVSVPPIQASPATALSLWTMVDEAGYFVPAGTQVSIEASGEISLGFITVGDTTIAPGASKATILLQAVEPGTAGDGLSTDPQLIDALAFVSSVELSEVTSGGVDEEDEDTYLNRLVEENQTLSKSLIKARDFEIDARSIAGIARCKCIEAYNAGEGKEEAMAVSVYPIDNVGEASAAPVKEALEARQTGKLISGINYYIGTPDYTTIKGKVSVEVEAGFDPETVLAGVKAWWAEHFDPAKWGRPTQGDSGSGWVNQTKAYRLKTIGEIERLGGVGRVVTFEWAKGAGALGTSEELSLEGVAPLTKAGTLEASSV